MAFYHVAKWIVKGFTPLLYKVEVSGTEHIPEGGGFILCSNHISNYDPIFIGMQTKQRLYFMAKEELFKFPPLAWLMRTLGAFPVARGKGDMGAVDHAIDVVKGGNVLGIFPEGNCSADGKLLKLKSGVMVIAAETGGDLLPCAIKKGGRSLWRRRIYLRFGEMIPHEKLGIEGHVLSQIKAANHMLYHTLSSLLEEIS